MRPVRGSSADGALYGLGGLVKKHREQRRFKYGCVTLTLGLGAFGATMLLFAKDGWVAGLILSFFGLGPRCLRLSVSLDALTALAAQSLRLVRERAARAAPRCHCKL